MNQTLKDLCISIKLVFIILSLIGLIVVLISFIDTNQFLYSKIVNCQKLGNPNPCILCNGTTTFYVISKGELINGYELNPLAVFIYFLIVMSNIFLIYQLIIYKIKPQIGSK